MGVCLMDLQRPLDAAALLREASETYALRCGENANPTRRARAKLEAAQREIDERHGAPATQPVVGHGIRADEVAWFWRLAIVARDEQNPAAAVTYGELALRFAREIEGADSPTTHQVEQFVAEVKGQVKAKVKP